MYALYTHTKQNDALLSHSQHVKRSSTATTTGGGGGAGGGSRSDKSTVVPEKLKSRRSSQSHHDDKKLQKAVDSILQHHTHKDTPTKGHGRRMSPPTRRDSYSTVSTGPAERAILKHTRIQVMADHREGTRFIPLEITVYTTGPAVLQNGAGSSTDAASDNRDGPKPFLASSSSKSSSYLEHFPHLQKPRGLLPDARNIMDVYGDDDADIFFVPASHEAQSVTSSMEVLRKVSHKLNVGGDDDDDSTKSDTNSHVNNKSSKTQPLHGRSVKRYQSSTMGLTDVAPPTPPSRGMIHELSFCMGRVEI